MSQLGTMSPDPVRAVRIRVWASLLVEMSLHRAHRDNQPIGDLRLDKAASGIRSSNRRITLSMPETSR